MEPHEIIHQLQQEFPKLPKRLSQITSKCAETYRSHGREPKSRNPLQSGNCSPVTHYMEYVHQNEAAAPGAGKMLSDKVHRSLCAEFSDCDLTETDIHLSLIDEHSDCMRWLVNFNLEDATPNQLIAFERECAELQKVTADAMAKARATRRRKESRVVPMTNGNGVKR